MKQKYLRRYLLLNLILPITFLLLPASGFANPPSNQKDSALALNAKMQNLKSLLNSLLTKASSDALFHDPKNREETLNELKQLGNLAHGLSTKSSFPSSDPILKYLPNHLEADVSEAYLAYQQGNKAYARSLIRNISSFCIACHTSDASGPHFPGFSWQASLPLKPLELAQFYSATRQFDEAESIYSGIIQSPEANRDELVEAIRQSLEIALRVKNDPNLALSLIQVVMKAQNVPAFLKFNAIEWRKDIQNWNAKPLLVLETPDQMLKAAKKLMDSAHKQQKYFTDRSADMQYLHASVILHDLIKKAPPVPILGESLYLEGVCYDILNPYDFDGLNNFYFESCIRNAPHTELSEKCYLRYQQNLYLAYSGSAGTELPKDVKDRLLELWPISTRVKTPDKTI